MIRHAGAIGIIRNQGAVQHANGADAPDRLGHPRRGARLICTVRQLREGVIKASSLDLARAQKTLGTLRSEVLPGLAAEWLAGGLDTPSLRLLAGWAEPIRSDVGPVFERVLRELSLAPLDMQQALRVLGRHYAQAILAGEVEPYEGARLIWDEISGEYEPFEDVSAFVGLASQIEDYKQMALSHPDPYRGYIEACTRDIHLAAKEYLAGVEPST